MYVPTSFAKLYDQQKILDNPHVAHQRSNKMFFECVYTGRRRSDGTKQLEILFHIHTETNRRPEMSPRIIRQEMGSRGN